MRHTYPLSISVPGSSYPEANEFRNRLNKTCARIVGGDITGALSRFLVALEAGELRVVSAEPCDGGAHD